MEQKWCNQSIKNRVNVLWKILISLKQLNQSQRHHKPRYSTTFKINYLHTVNYKMFQPENYLSINIWLRSWSIGLLLLIKNGQILFNRKEGLLMSIIWEKWQYLGPRLKVRTHPSKSNNILNLNNQRQKIQPQELSWEQKRWQRSSFCSRTVLMEKIFNRLLLFKVEIANRILINFYWLYNHNQCSIAEMNKNLLIKIQIPCLRLGFNWTK